MTNITAFTYVAGLSEKLERIFSKNNTSDSATPSDNNWFIPRTKLPNTS